jgi:hypothetical protein
VKVYLVSTGDYSAWQVCGLFSTRETAEKCRAMLGPDANEVDEWTLDEFADRVQRGVMVWLVWSKRDGGVEIDGNRVHNFGVDVSEPVGVVSCFTEPEQMKVLVEAADEAHAVKIAADKFREHVALRGVR